MAHPKSRVSKSKKNKRRTHHKALIPQLTVCKTTGETHMMHRAYWHEGSMYYNGKMVIQAKEAEEVE
jgi:large subunit ribosomal protein L32